MPTEFETCCICGKPFRENEWGNNPYPVKEHGMCCDKCNTDVVIPKRIENLYKHSN